MDLAISIGFSVISIVLTYIITRHYYHRQQTDINKGVKLYDVQPGKVNEEFYVRFNSDIRRAKEQVFITGRGLKMDTPREKELAEDYLNSFSSALKKAEVLRIQFGENASPEWYSACKEIWMNNKEKFHFYILNRKDDLLHSAAIDPYLGSCVGEMMMPSTVITKGGQKKDIAGAAIFIKGNNEISQSIANRIVSLKDEGLAKGICQKIDSEPKWDKLIEETRN